MSKLFGGGGGNNAAIQQQIEQQRVETQRQREQVEAERREITEKVAASGKARRRAGARALLAETRLNPEDGIDDTLGSSKGLM